MRRTVFSALALTCTALLASAAPALADSSTPSPVPTRVAEDAASPVPSTGPSDDAASPVPARDASAVPAERGQVAVRPSGAPDTGVADTSSGTATGGLVGGGAAAVLLAGGAATFVVRRRRTHGA
ncbi:sortase-dependent protein [Streptomyces sp. NPDC057412]|uniref:sortase-dependent protein n=1 Tax=Streptomyces sp. NPDC057412 TaxID=3346123 RepID=UPI0036A37C05